jgi:hypothetical protein
VSRGARIQPRTTAAVDRRDVRRDIALPEQSDELLVVIALIGPIVLIRSRARRRRSSIGAAAFGSNSVESVMATSMSRPLRFSMSACARPYIYSVAAVRCEIQSLPAAKTRPTAALARCAEWALLRRYLGHAFRAARRRALYRAPAPRHRSHVKRQAAAAVRADLPRVRAARV